MKSQMTSDERPRPKALRFTVQDLPARPSPNFYMFTQDIQSRILLRRSDSTDISIKFEGRDEERDRADRICALIGEDRYNSEGQIQAAIERIVFYLAFQGRALFELVRDSDGAITDVVSFLSDRVWILFGNYLQVPPRRSWSELEAKYAVLRHADVWRVEMPHELGGYRGYRRLLAEISRWPSLGPKFQEEDLKEGRWPRDFVIGDYRRAHEVQRYRATRRWGWNGRDWNSQYATEYYEFYRLLTSRWSIEVLRRHVVQELNRLLQRLGIKASVVLEGLPSPDEILDARDRMEKGEIDFAEASKITQPRRIGMADS